MARDQLARLRRPGRRGLRPGAGERGAGRRDELTEAVATWRQPSTRAHGGWGGAPKFPQSMTIEFLLREHLRSGDARPLAMARRTLDAMAAGGINDQLARRLRALLDRRGLAGAALREDALRQRAAGPRLPPRLARDRRAALRRAWRGRRSTSWRATCAIRPAAGFAASLDADTDGEEGATYVWTAAEVRAGARRRRRELFEAAYDVTPNGNWEGHTILRRVRTDEALAADVGSSAGRASSVAWRPRVERLTATRAARPQPRRDDKVLTAWNGLALAAFADAGWALGRTALHADRRGSRGRSCWTRCAGRTGACAVPGRTAARSTRGVLEDYTHLADGLLALYEATFEERWFARRARSDGGGPAPLRRSGGRLLRHGRRPRGADRATARAPGQRPAVRERHGRQRPAAPPRADRRGALPERG